MRVRFEIRQFAALLTLGASLAAHACPNSTPPNANLSEELTRLEAMATLCATDAAYHRLRGQTLLAAGQTGPALEAIELSLFLEPDHPGTQLDYVQALIAASDLMSASNLLRELGARPDAPAHLRPLIAEQLQAIERLEQPPFFAASQDWRSRVSYSLAAGFDSNLNNAPSASQLTLTFPQGNVVLPIEANSQPSSGGVVTSTVQWLGVKPVGKQLYILQAEARHRHAAPTETRFSQGDLALTWLQAPEESRQWVVRTSASTAYLDGANLLQSLRANGQRQWRYNKQCRPGLGAEVELRKYPTGPVLDGRYQGVIATLACQEAPGSDTLGLEVRAGQDQAKQGQRPGGAQRQTEIRAAWQTRFGRYALQADYGWLYQADAVGYSPLLDNNQTRRITRHRLRLELSAPIATALTGLAQWFIVLEGSRQSSTLAAFAARQQSVTAGLRWQFE